MKDDVFGKDVYSPGYICWVKSLQESNVWVIFTHNLYSFSVFIGITLRVTGSPS